MVRLANQPLVSGEKSRKVNILPPSCQCSAMPAAAARRMRVGVVGFEQELGRAEVVLPEERVRGGGVVVAEARRGVRVDAVAAVESEPRIVGGEFSFAGVGRCVGRARIAGQPKAGEIGEAIGGAAEKPRRVRGRRGSRAAR